MTSLTESSSLDRRAFLSRTGLLGTASAMAPALASILTTGSADAASFPLPLPGVARDIAIFRVALNLEYLESEFYTHATTGQGLAETGIPINGTGTQGPTIVKANSLVPFQNPIIKQFASELAFNERNHVLLLRSVITAAGQTPPAKATVNLLDSFNMLAQAAGIGQTFDPFADDISFLLAALTFEEVGVTAFHGGAPLLTSPLNIKNSAGILGTEAYQAGAIRSMLAGMGGAAAIANANKISALRASLSNSGDDDQGITNADGTANIVAADANSLAFSRTLNSAFNIVFGAKGVSQGMFYPNGVNV